jgi:Tfp pilus assembly protein PilO
MKAPARGLLAVPPYAWPFLGLLAMNLVVFMAFTLPRSVSERRTAREAIERRAAIDGKRKEMRAIRSQADTIRSDLKDAASFYKDVVTDCARANAMVPRELYHTTAEHHIQTARQSIRDSETKGLPLHELEVVMPVAGTYQQIGEFLQAVERSPTFLIVDRINLRERLQEGGGADLDVQIKAYCVPEGKKARP